MRIALLFILVFSIPAAAVENTMVNSSIKEIEFEQMPAIGMPALI